MKFPPAGSPQFKVLWEAVQQFVDNGQDEAELSPDNEKLAADLAMAEAMLGEMDAEFERATMAGVTAADLLPSYYTRSL